jgi:hypothetical protein
VEGTCLSIGHPSEGLVVDVHELEQGLDRQPCVQRVLHGPGHPGVVLGHDVVVLEQGRGAPQPAGDVDVEAVAGGRFLQCVGPLRPAWVQLGDEETQQVTVLVLRTADGVEVDAALEEHPDEPGPFDMSGAQLAVGPREEASLPPLPDVLGRLPSEPRHIVDREPVARAVVVHHRDHASTRPLLSGAAIRGTTLSP